MKFRTTTIWVALISTGMLCLAVGAVRIPRKPKATSRQSAPATTTQQPTPSVIPMRVSQPAPASQVGVAGSTGSSMHRQGAVERVRQQSSYRQPTAQSQIEDFPRTPQSNSGGNSRFGAIGNFVPTQPVVTTNERRSRQSGYEEPEAWPFHQKPAGGSGFDRRPQTNQLHTGQTQSSTGSQIADWPYQPTVSETANSQWPAVETSERLTNPPTIDQFPFNTPVAPYNDVANFPAASLPQVSREHRPSAEDLLNPALSFGGQPVRQGQARPGQRHDAHGPPTIKPLPQTQPLLNSVTNPFAPATPQLATPQLTTSQPTNDFARQTPAHPRIADTAPPAPAPSLSNLPAPQTSSIQQQNVLEAGHAGPNGRVIHAYAESVTPRSNITVGQWSGPQNRPVQSIQRVSFDSCPDCEDMSWIPAESLINPYAARANRYPDRTPQSIEAGQLVELPRNYAPWWEEVINKPLRAAPSSRPVNVESLIFEAIQHSPQVTAFRIDPIIRETQILEEAAEFDWQSFIETKFDDSNDPIGNELTAGVNLDRFTDKHFTSRLGLEKRMAQGGTLDVTQNFGMQDNNSRFFTPRQQGTSRLELNYTQPLLRGAGHTYNESRTVLAMLDHQISEDDLQDSLQDHLLEVYTTYWNLYRARAVRLQKERLLRRALDVEQKLTARQGIDSVRRQVLRARAAIASRRSEIARADMEVRNAESRLRLLVNSPGLKHSTAVELLPVEAPMSEYLTVSMRGSVETALQNRPDIRRAITQMKETAVRLEVSKNELLPRLDVVLGTYVAGLRGKRQVDTAWTEQFRDGRPGYTVGLMLQYPLGNRAAKARYARREWEVAKTLKEFEASVEASMSEVELSVREFETSYQEMLSRFQSMIAADTEANYLLERWRLLPGNDQTTSFLLEDLLDAQERVAMEEQDFVEAQVAYVLSVVRLKRASGILLSCDCGDSPVSFMTPAPRGLAQPKHLPQPVGQRPVLPAPKPVNAKLTPPLPVLPRTQTSATQSTVPRLTPLQPTNRSQDAPSIIPLPGPTILPVPARSQL